LLLFCHCLFSVPEYNAILSLVLLRVSCYLCVFLNVVVWIFDLLLLLLHVLFVACYFL
jgi:hypothetical protein